MKVGGGLEDDALCRHAVPDQGQGVNDHDDANKEFKKDTENCPDGRANPGFKTLPLALEGKG